MPSLPGDGLEGATSRTYDLLEIMKSIRSRRNSVAISAPHLVTDDDVLYPLLNTVKAGVQRSTEQHSEECRCVVIRR